MTFAVRSWLLGQGQGPTPVFSRFESHAEGHAEKDSLGDIMLNALVYL